MPSTIYIANIVREIREILPKLNSDYSAMTTISDIFDYIKAQLISNFENARSSLHMLYRNHFPNYYKIKPPVAMDETLDLVIARSLGFDDYAHYTKNAEVALNSKFEKAVHNLLIGDIANLVQMIQEDPGLLYANSVLGHRARLIDYISSNGVEIWRQIVPSNADEILDEICKFDFDRYVTNNIYGGNTVRSLIETSAHPKAAKITYRLLEVLSKHKL